ncbi:Gluconate transport inducer 1/Pac2 [Moelleriella libera RCEF 2490]|uniref:Gluconate transport inducer 1/Pac2 n=1 Tax=Moelleriella libera RCEF 2490 TaxID=1081109 RepID=A0A168ADX8_9HYPO|nr:Gluconate transport inducer 1/Pac2 [Moelleriella libera RCEF 2490]
MTNFAPLTANYYGFIGSTRDALILFQQCLNGEAAHAPRRPHERERAELIVSGAIFLYEEQISGIKRWTDGVSWSPSRILDNFLVYRELTAPFPAGQRKRALKRDRRVTASGAITRDRGESSSSSSTGLTAQNLNAVRLAVAGQTATGGIDSDAERALVGSLTDSYKFREGGLIKKTVSIKYNNIVHHLVSYYKMEDVLQGRLMRPSHQPTLRNMILSPVLTDGQNFKHDIDHAFDFTPYYPNLDPMTVPLPLVDNHFYQDQSHFYYQNQQHQHQQQQQMQQQQQQHQHQHQHQQQWIPGYYIPPNTMGSGRPSSNPFIQGQAVLDQSGYVWPEEE